MQWAKQKSGFTIVELLIVVVVIAILAAITIVAYNGIQNRAKASAAQSTASQVSKKILLYATQNADLYPPNLAAAGVINTQGIEYTYNNDVTPRTYGVTVTNGAFSYYVSSTTPQATAGGYNGHGQGGVAAITNLIPNPSFEGGATGWTLSSNISVSLQATGGLYGDKFYRGTRTSTAAIGMYSAKFNIDPNETYTARMSARYAAGQQTYLRFQWFDSTGVSIGSNTDSVWVTSSNVNTWQTLTYSYAAPANATSSRLDVILTTVGGGVAGDVLDVDGVMVVKGSTTGGYADGNTTNWVWNDAANANTASTSTGPRLP